MYSTGTAAFCNSATNRRASASSPRSFSALMTKKGGSCTVSRAINLRQGKNKSARKGQKAGTVQANPAIAKCDVAQAIVDTKKRYDAAVAKINKQFKGPKHTKTRQSRIASLDASYGADLRAAYSAETAALVTDKKESARLTKIKTTVKAGTATELLDTSDTKIAATLETALNAVDTAYEPKSTAPVAASPSPAP